MRFVLGGVEQRQRAAISAFQNRFNGVALLVQFGVEFLVERRPAFGVVVEPFSQFTGRGQLLAPFVGPQVFLFDAARPDAVHQYAIAIIFVCVVVDPLALNPVRLLHTCTPCGYRFAGHPAP